MRNSLLKAALAAMLLPVCTGAMALDEVDGTYQIGTPQDLVDFANMVNEGNPAVNAVLTADIDLEGVQMPCIGTFNGVFDGQGFAIHNYTYTTTAANQGLFGTTVGATIQNFSIDGTLNADHGQTGLIGYADGNDWEKKTVIRNVQCAVDVNINNNGHSGGVVGSLRNAWVDQCVYSGTLTLLHSKGDSDGGIAGYSNTGKISNCIFSGKIVITQNNNNMGGILGYVNNGDFKGLNGCLSTGTIEGGNDDKIAAILGHANTGTKPDVLHGNFYLEGTANKGMAGGSAVETPALTAEQLASGEIAYKLNEYNESPVWFQQIGTDPMPTLGGTAVVYASGTLNCDGTPATEVTYSNTPSEITQTPHDYDANGFCTVCGALTMGEDGYYEIATGDALRWVATQVNSGNREMNLRITADLDLGGDDWVPIGHDGSKFVGNVDGGYHTISNMTVNHSEPGAGLFGTVEKGNIQNLIIDASCSVTGTQYAGGLIGHSYGGFEVNITRVGVLCDVTCVGEAAAGIIGNANSGSICNMTECFTTGIITAAKDAACFSGWQGNVGAKIVDCWSISEVTGFQDEAHYLARYGGLTLTNCWSAYGTQGGHIEVDDAASGKLAYLLNGSSFMNPKWFQNIGTDAYPTWDSTHGIVYHAGDDTYGCITDEASYKAFVTSVLGVEERYAQEAIATQALLDAYIAQIAEAGAITDRDAFLVAYAALMESRKEIEASVVVYETFRVASEEAIAYLDANPITGELVDLLDQFLNADVDPNETYPNGSFSYIMANHKLTNEEVTAQQLWVEETLQQAIAADYVAGSEVTSLVQNPTFADGFEGWTLNNYGDNAPWTATVEGIGSAAEAWNTTFDLNQTLTGMKNGIYVLKANAAFRAYGEVTSTLHAAQLYLNGTVNYVMMENEDYISKDVAVDGENCHLTGDATDYSYVYGEVEGWVPMGPVGCTYAFKANRYENSVAVEVTDGTLKMGITNPGTGLEKDWTGFGNFRLFYLGTADEAAAALDEVLADYADRAATIAAFIPSQAEDYAKYPNFSEALKAELAQAVEAIPAAADGAAKMALIEKFSQLFKDIYECRKAYIELVATAESAQTIVQAMVDQGFVAAEDVAGITADYNAAWNAFIDGTASAEEALALIEKFNSNPLYPPYKDGAYQLATVNDWTVFAMIVNAGASNMNAALTADLDFAGHTFTPIGWNMVDDCAAANDTYVFRGTFDGNGHTISNAIVDKPGSIGAGYFGSIGSPAVIKNLRIDNTCYVVGSDRAGLVGRSTGGGEIWLENLGNEGSVTAGLAAAGILGNANSGSIARIKNCYSTGDIKHPTGESWKNCAQICGWFGSVGATIENCWSISSVIGFDEMKTIFARVNNDQSKFVNCYSNTGQGNMATVVNNEMVHGGELTFLLNSGNTEAPVWRQNLGEGENVDAHPVLDATHLIVYKAEDGTFYNTKEDAIVNVSGDLGKRVNVFDVQGRLLRNNVDVSVSLKGLPRGMYILKGDKGAGRTIVK